MHTHDHPADIVLIVNHQNGRSIAQSDRLRRRLHNNNLPITCREIKREFAAMSFLAHHSDSTAMCPGNTQRCCKPKSSTSGLGGKKGAKDVFECVRTHA